MDKKHTCPICGHEVAIEKIEESSGMDGRYYDWRITCPNCHLLQIEYSADGFYGRDYCETAEDALAKFDRHCLEVQYKMDSTKVIAALEALSKAMSENQCYTCSHEFIDAAEEFGTNIISDAITLLKTQDHIIRISMLKK